MAERVISPPEVPHASPLEHSRRQLEALLEVSEAIAQQRDLPALFHDLAARLHSVIDFDFLTLVLHDAAKNVDRKSTRLNSSHVSISYAVFCLKKKKKNMKITNILLHTF